jgi:ABC-type dipeptide/oligopeptide/nickel transport system ATPase component
MSLLDIKNLELSFRSYKGSSKVLHGIDLNIKRGERVALVGESGSGKSVTARLVLGLLQEAHNATARGQILFDGQDVNLMKNKDRASLRGTDISMIFQDPTSSLNPSFTIETQFYDVLKRRTPSLTKNESFERASQLLDDVSIADPERVLKSYNFQMSGGMNQRIMIAMALANKPKLLLADEPGTALDVTVQSQTLKLMRDLVSENDTAVLLISHNLGVVREFADRLYVIYRGRIVEEGPTVSIFDNPQHGYTKALLNAIPRITGGGLPEIAEETDDYLAPKITHGAV